ncbi:MAG: AsmA-like C-terminal domain-containing protein [Bdellovibrionales bacterium]
MLKRSSLIVLEWLAGFIGIGIVLGAVLFVRLAANPITMEDLTPILIDRLSDPSRGISASISSSALRWDSDQREIVADLQGLILHNKDGGVIATVPQAEARVRALPLLIGSVRFSSVKASGANINLERTIEGQLTLLGVEPQVKVKRKGVGGMGALLAKWPERVNNVQNQLERLGNVSVTASRLTITDRIADTTLTGTMPSLVVETSSNDAITGTGTLTIDTKPQPVTLTLDLRLFPDQGTGETIISFDQINPAMLGRMDQDYGALLPVDVTFKGYANITYMPDATMQATVAIDSLDKGVLIIPDMTDPLTVDKLSLNASLVATDSAGINRVTLNYLKAQRAGATITLTGTVGMAQSDDVRDLTVQAVVQNLPMNDVSPLWPVTAASNARAWVIPNMRDGMVTEATFEIVGQIPWADDGPKTDGFTYSKVGGTITLDNATVDYYRPLPPITQARAVATYDDKAFHIVIGGGRLLGLSLKEGGVVDIGGLSEDIQPMKTTVTAAGPLTDVLTVISSKPLEYLQKLDLDAQSMTGDVELTLDMGLPLLNALKMEEVDLKIDATAKNFASEKLVPALKLTQGDMRAQITTKQMSVKGDVTASGARVNVDWLEDFTAAAGQPGSTATIRANFIKPELEALGIDMVGAMDGALPATLTYKRFTAQPDELALQVDLTPVALDIPRLTYKKAKDVKGALIAEGTIKDGVITIDDIDADGPALDIKGSATLGKDGSLQSLKLATARIGENNAVIDYDKTGGVPKINIKGKQLNIGAFMDDGAAKPEEEKKPDEPASSYDIVIDLERAVFASEDAAAGRKERYFAPFKLSAARNMEGWQRISLNASASGAVPLLADLTPTPSGQSLTLETRDLGKVMYALDWTDDIMGGWLQVAGRGKPGKPLYADMIVSDYRVLDLPFLVRLLSAVSLDGILTAAKSSEGLAFKRLKGEIIIEGDNIKFKDVRTSGGALGLTAAGTINAETNNIDLEGTVVPFSTANKMLGSIPIVGQLLTGGEGGGLFAATYYAKGKLDDPQVSVNPLSVLAPGFLRNVFFLDND